MERVQRWQMPDDEANLWVEDLPDSVGCCDVCGEWIMVDEDHYEFDETDMLICETCVDNALRYCR